LHSVQIQAALEEKKTGRESDFAGNMYSGVFGWHMDFLQAFEKQNLLAYHVIMAKLFSEVS
jgi:hypothetical protein